MKQKEEEKVEVATAHDENEWGITLEGGED